MRILIIKMSSIGDIIHTFPAIMDAKRYIKDLKIDWVVDESFIEIPKLQQHNQNQAIDRIISIPLRKIKRNIFFELINYKFKNFINELKQEQYDLVIDAQGLIKSAIIAKFANTKQVVGFDVKSCREPFASFFYHSKIQVDRKLHAILRTRQLFAKSLNYNFEDIDYGLEQKFFPKLINLIEKNIEQYVVFLHGTTWETKHWSLEYWQKLSLLISDQNMPIVIMTNNSNEAQFAEQLVGKNNTIIVLSQLSIFQVACILANASAVVAVDTGFAHLSGAFGVPIVGIYGATCIVKSGVMGAKSINLQSKYHCSPCLSRVCLEYQNKHSLIKQPCLQEITPEMVFAELEVVCQTLKK